jgi:hypothetical protein
LVQRSSNSNCGDSAYSGSPKSTLSDRQNTFDEDDRKEIEEDDQGFDNQVKALEKKE